ncbi:MAG: alpha/beta fold hydrolase [Hydrogenophaga sp.]|jgi:pimeloyl-ACP methyl ester carboxylesterase|uniref:alpha/beta fold hydrolase n=1 Tax=Hydrogenophaga sp. TaxID=1904254 RepID=UPI000EEDB6E6|nr:alpha/beta hydrolase [Hydrogenophaga sp.]MDD3785430.1 alpha/beta fold hydrolase [Hydrogenophaga sp.]MDX9968245.1 alpha/beta fold hydrolase [Hydrogenophaga sp.]HAJ12666.1 alpha/beta hydrolase [Comamonadaceae bacterium]
MNVHRLDVEGLSVVIEGEGPVVVFLHGWPDSPALWDGLVASLRGRWTCVRLALPGFDLSRPPRPVSVDEMCRLLAVVVDAVSPGAPVTLVLHDWGCFFGYEYAARHVDRVVRVVGVDIGDSNSGAYLKGLTAREKLLIAGYQLWLATAWKLGAWWPSLADRLTRFMARQVGCRTDPAAIGWQMNYPYAMQWFGSYGGLRGVARVHKVFGPRIPILFCYGRRKPFMFHSQPWVESLDNMPGSAARGFDAGHWLMRQQPAEFAQVVSAWLDRSREAA